MNRLLGQIVMVCIALGFGAGGMLYIQDNRREAELTALKESLLRLTRQERRAEFRVIAQHERDGRLETTMRFVEVNDRGREVGRPRAFTIEGDIIHVDALIIKFDDDLALSGDQARGHPLLLFRRAYGDHQTPASGFSLDAVNEVPGGYLPEGAINAWEARLWEEFWEVANNPGAYEGVRAAHGVVNYTRAIAGARYLVTLRSTGELSTEVLPASP